MPAPFIQNPQSLSFSQNKADIQNWKRNLPNYQQYKTFYEDEAGDIIDDQIAGFSTYISYNNIVSTKENYLFYCMNRDSAIGVTSNYSYNAFRGINQHVQLRVTPNNNYQLVKYEQCGIVNGIPISPVKDYTLITGQAITIEVVVGEIFEQEITAPNNRLFIFRFAEPKISYDLKVVLNEVEIPYVINIADMLKDYWYVQSNTYGGVDVYYLNESLLDPLYSYTTGNVVKIIYIKLANTIYNFPDDINFFYGTINEHADTTILYNYKSPESKESIQINGPLYNETRRTIRAREDAAKMFKILNTEFVDTNSRDVNLPVIYLDVKRAIPAFVDVTYVKDDTTLLSTQDKNALTIALNGPGVRPHGIPIAEIQHPKKIAINLNLTLTKRTGLDNSTYETDIAEILNYYYDERNIKRYRSKNTSYTLNLKGLEHDLENLAYIEIARIGLQSATWAAATNFKRGQFILPTVSNTKMYEVISQTYNGSFVNTGVVSSGTQPTWSTTNNALTFEGISVWQPSTAYNVGDLVHSITPTILVYKVHSIASSGVSGLSEPTWGAIINELFYDGQVTWQVKSPYEITNKLIYKTHTLTQHEFGTDWNEYFYFTPVITWV